MTNYETISSGICPKCQEALRGSEHSENNGFNYYCDKCFLRYIFQDDMGPGSYTTKPMTEQTEQERLNRLMAEKVMGFVDGPVKGWYFKNRYDSEFIKAWNPWGDIGQAMECLMAAKGYTGGVYQISDGRWLGFVSRRNVIADIKAIATEPSTAIVKALEAAVKGGGG